MKFLLSLLLLTFISCNGASEGEATVNDGTSQVEDVTAEYLGEYHTGCTQEVLENPAAISFMTAKIVKVHLDHGNPYLFVEEYAEANCTTLLVTRKYEVDFVMENTFFQGELVDTSLKLDILSSSFTLNHSAYNGYNDCGFPASQSIEYLLGSPCTPNLDGKQESYQVEDLGNGDYKLSGSRGQFTFSKQ